MSQELIKTAKELVSDIKKLNKEFKENKREVVSKALAENEEMVSRSIVHPIYGELNFPELEAALKKERLRVLETGHSALEKIAQDDLEAELTEFEKFGLEAIVHLIGRPALLVSDGSFIEPPHGWEILEQYRNTIQKTCASAGRIEFSDHPYGMPWAGTGFVVAKDVIMTNRHVLETFANKNVQNKWDYLGDVKPRIDFVAEYYTDESKAFEISGVIGAYDKPGPDLALLRVSTQNDSGDIFPKPLTIASDKPDPLKERQVCTIGYPASDPTRNDPTVMSQIFSDIYDVKRVQPGRAKDLVIRKKVFTHDCSTLGGNSGSCVLDFEAGLVVGLHFSGRYLLRNYAVALWELKDDPLLVNANVNFD